MADWRENDGAPIAWEKGQARPLACPGCGARADMAREAAVLWPIPKPRTLGLHRCPSCRTLVVADAEAPPYEQVVDTQVGAALTFYVEQGASLDFLCAQAEVAAAHGARAYAEFGCGFGFSLDYARHGLGMAVAGIDPSPLAAAGRSLLCLPIESRYASVEAPPAGAPFDAIGAFEVIEHVPDPQALLAAMRAALKPNGLALLSTPDAAAIRPETPPGLLHLVLSPGYHLFFLSSEGLEAALRRAGFSEVQVVAQDATLRAAAGPGASQLDMTALLDRQRFRAYLAERARTAPVGSPLRRGMLARLAKEEANRGDWNLTAEALAAYEAEVRDAFGLDLSKPLSSQELARWRGVKEFEDLVAALPISLPSVLLRRAQLRLARGEDADAQADAACAAATAETVRGALSRIGSDDAELEELQELAAASGLEAALARGAALPPEVPSRRASFVFQRLVHRDKAALAAPLAEAARKDARARSDADAAWCLGVFALSHEKSPSAAAEWFGLSAQWANAEGRTELAWRAAAEEACAYASEDAAAGASCWASRRAAWRSLPPADISQRAESRIYQALVRMGLFDRARLFSEGARQAALVDRDWRAAAHFGADALSSGALAEAQRWRDRAADWAFDAGATEPAWASAIEAALAGSLVDPGEANARWRERLDRHGPPPDAAAEDRVAVALFQGLIARGDHVAAQTHVDRCRRLAQGEAPQRGLVWALGIHALNGLQDDREAAWCFDRVAELAAARERDWHWRARAHAVFARARARDPDAARLLEELDRPDHPERAVILEAGGGALALARDALLAGAAEP